MNRKLKFRVWDGEKFLFSEQSTCLSNDEGGHPHLKFYFDKFFKFSGKYNFILQEFTGLLDSDGKEIYEGDICHAFKANSYLDGNYTVTWNEKKGRWYYKEDTKYQVGSSGNLKCRVIGNIIEGNKLAKKI